MTTSPELYELFLALAPLRLQAGRDAIEAGDPEPERTRRVSAVLIPFAVDATLLGADGLAVLAQAIVRHSHRADGDLVGAVDALAGAVAELAGGGDESGARVDEGALLDRAKQLDDRGNPRAAPAEAAAGATVATAWTPNLADEMVAAFIDECSERLEGLSDKLLTLEANPDPELVGAIFRDLHTVKGSSAFAGLMPMNRVSHAAEDLIAEIRSGKRAVDRRLVDTLLAALDVLRAILAKANAGEPIDVDERPILARLRDPSATPAAESASAPLPTAAAQEAPPSLATAAASPATLRIGFEKVDLLLNLVGELVLAKGRLLSASERQMTIPVELAQLRRRLGQIIGRDDSALGRPAADGLRSRDSITLLLDDVQRAERALSELCGEVEGGIETLNASLGLMRDQVMKLRMVPISRLFSKYQRTLRELSDKLGKEVRLEITGGETELDKMLVEQLDDPLLHIVRNSVDHGIESPETRVGRGKPRAGRLVVTAAQTGGSVVVTISDDGAGLDVERLKAKAVERGLITDAEARAMSEEDALDLVFRPGLSTAKEISDVSGRGVGMDVVRDAIVRLKGTIHLTSRRGEGTRIELRFPLTLAIAPVIAARVGSEIVALPLDAVVAAQNVDPAQLDSVAGAASLRHEGRLLAVIDLAALLGVETDGSVGSRTEGSFAVVVDVGERFALIVDELVGRHEVVVKPLGPLFAGAPFVAGACLIDDRVVLLLDLVAVTEGAAQSRSAAPRGPRGGPAGGDDRPRTTRLGDGRRILVADDSEVVRQSLRRALEARGFEVVVAEDGREALDIARAQSFDAITSDVVMPHMDGLELVRALRADPRYERTPIVLLSAKEGRVDELRGADAGADVYMKKPVTPQAFVEQLAQLLARTEKGV